MQFLNNNTMRSILSISALIAGIILFSAYLSFPDDSSRAVFSFAKGGELSLPDQPFDYMPEPFPIYFFNGDISYYHNIDSASFRDISNDKATLGRVLFYDELLAANENISCATCHQQANSFADNVRFSMGVEQNSTLNTPHLNDLGWSNNEFFTWDMRETNLIDAIAIPLKHPNEIGATNVSSLLSKMAATDYYPELFDSAFGDPAISEERIKLALAQFISAMTTFDTQFDRVLQLKESFPTSLEGAGNDLFDTACRSCHILGTLAPTFNTPIPTETLLTINKEKFSNGLPLVATDLGAGSWNEKFNGLFKVQTLRNIANTAPYMHDGRFATLEEVVEHYSSGLPAEQTTPWGLLPENGFQFSEFQKRSLVAFMKTFTDDSFLNDVRFSDPFEHPEDEYEPYVYPEAIRAFPNPTSGPLNLSFDNHNQRNVEIHIMNINGQLLRQLSSHKNGVYTAISDWPAGIYLVRLIDGDQPLKEIRIIKQ